MSNNNNSNEKIYSSIPDLIFAYVVPSRNSTKKINEKSIFPKSNEFFKVERPKTKMKGHQSEK